MISSDIFWGWIFQWWRLLAIIAVIITVVVLYLNNTIVSISVNTPAGSDKRSLRLEALTQSGSRGGFFQLGSFAIIPRDTGRIEATMGTWQTTAEIAPLPWVGIKEVAISVERDRNADKVSGDSLGCTTFNKSDNQIASYKCFDPFGLYVYKTSEKDGASWQNEAYLTFPRAYSVTPFKNGLLGISNSPNPQLFFADMDTKTTQLPLLPRNFNPSHLGSVALVSDTEPDSNNYLLLDHRDGSIYFANPQNGVALYRQFVIEKNLLTGGSIQCVLRGEVAHCYVGASGFDPHSEEDIEAREKRPDGRILTINFGSDNIGYTSSLVPRSQIIDQLYSDGSQNLFAKVNTTLYRLDTSGPEVKRTIITPDVGDVSSGNTLYYIANNKLYELDSKTNQTFLRFSASTLTLSKISQIGSGVFIDAYVEGSPRGDNLHTFQLLSEQNTTPGERLVDKLSLHPGDHTNIVSMDYYKNNIHIVIPRYVEFDKNDEIVPSERLTSEARQEAINYLATVIPNIQEYDITFSQVSR